MAKQKVPIKQKPLDKAKGADLSRRAAKSRQMPDSAIDAVAAALRAARGELEKYAAHLRTLDRRRLNRIGINRLGFIERAAEYVRSTPQFIPSYLDAAAIERGNEYSRRLRTLLDLANQIDELLVNLNAAAADADYTNLLAYYATVSEAARRRIDSAEPVYQDLEIFFKHKKDEAAPVTQKKLKSDFNALLHNKREGRIEVENVKPKRVSGKRRIIDETFKEMAQFKETEEGETE